MGCLSKIREHINKLSEDDRQRLIKDYIKKMRIARKIAKDITENGGQSTQTNR